MNAVFGLLLLAISGVFDLFGRFFVKLEMASWYAALITFIAVAMFLVKPLISGVEIGHWERGTSRKSGSSKRSTSKRSSSRSGSEKGGD